MAEHQHDRIEDESGRGKLIVTVIVVLAIAVAVVLWLWSQQSEPAPQPVDIPVAVDVEEPEPEPEVIAEPEPMPTVELEAEPVAEPEPEVELPALGESTPEVLSYLETAEQSVAPLRSEQLVRDATVFVDNLRNGIVIRDKAIIEGPQTRFRVLEQNDKLYVDPRSFDRYNTVVDWFVSLDTAVLVDGLDRYEPLVKQALSEIGYPDAEPETVLIEAIDMLLATPSVGTVIELNDDKVMYRYADPELESLPDAQKQMLRMGPDNIRRVKLKLESLKAELLAAQ
ncbi:MAG TPA: DUF3014 domain-containing protein [Pseudidiomarina sp.]|nr:DUF3014 domain-containing protein [Pseudidiomarina sp.]